MYIKRVKVILPRSAVSASGVHPPYLLVGPGYEKAEHIFSVLRLSLPQLNDCKVLTHSWVDRGISRLYLAKGHTRTTRTYTFSSHR